MHHTRILLSNRTGIVKPSGPQQYWNRNVIQTGYSCDNLLHNAFDAQSHWNLYFKHLLNERHMQDYQDISRQNPQKKKLSSKILAWRWQSSPETDFRKWQRLSQNCLGSMTLSWRKFGACLAVLWRNDGGFPHNVRLAMDSLREIPHLETLQAETCGFSSILRVTAVTV